MPSDHAAHFAHLDQLLSTYRPLWQIRPFHQRSLCWQDSHPDLSRALLALNASELHLLETDDTASANWLRPWLGDDLEALRALISLKPFPQRSLPIPPRLDTGIPGRKWAQIQAFAAALPADNRPLLEWCAGKGYLGRLLAMVDSRQVISLERDGALCAAGRAEAGHFGATMEFVEADAFNPQSARWLPAAGQAVALHACGDLHTTLMQHWVTSACQRITLSPCCYHLTGNASYQPLSNQGKASALQLDKLDLGLAVKETVTGGQGAARKRQAEVLWRLAFDEWQRQQRGSDDYLPLPSFPKSLLSGTFTAFCRWAAQAKGIAAPQGLDEQHWLARGAQRQDLVRRMELVSQRFRRPLEIWLALDRVLFLQEQGASVRLGTFCAKPLTPRNILIDAEWP